MSQPSGPQLSADGQWWWDGATWVPAMSADGMWRWDGSRWMPAAPLVGPVPAGSGPGLAVGLVLGCLVILLVSTVPVIIILLTMGNQISNVFSNVVNALSGP